MGPSPPVGSFGPPALSASISSAAQTLSPDNRTLTLLFNNLSVHVQGSGPRADTAAGSLTVPLVGLSSSAFVKISFRGEAVIAGTGAVGRLNVEVNGFAQANGFSNPGASIQQELTVQLAPDFPAVVLNMVLSGQAFGADVTDSALVALDSIDLSLQ